MITARSGSQSNKQASASSAGCLGIFGVLFAAAGIFFGILTVKDFSKTVEARGWDKVPATLTEIDISASRGEDPPFAIRAKFSYRVAGRKFTSERFALGDFNGAEYEDLALKIKEVRGQSQLIAYVNPDDPAEAVLEPGSLSSGFLILIPLVFAAVGLACVFGAIQMVRGAKNRGLEGAGEVETAISSSPTKRGGGAVAGIVVGAVFAAIGIGLLYPLAVRPFVLSGAAKGWIETPCKIIWAGVKSHQSDDGTTYSVDIFYAYEFEGQQHRSNRYSFFGGSSSGQTAKREVADRFRDSRAPVCFVDPETPERAVLKRELGAAGLLALIPIVLLLVGVPLVVHCLRLWRKGRDAKSQSHGSSLSLQGDHTVSEKRDFSPGTKRITMAAVALFVSLFWNGIVFGFLFPEAWLQDGGIFLKLFSIPFILIGLALVFAVVYCVFSLFNPTPVLTLEPGEPELGIEAFLKWHFRGSTGRLKNLRIIVRGTESATYRRGTDEVTEKRTFFAAAIVEETQAIAMRAGSAEFTIPHDLMYSLRLSSNAITWKIEVRGGISYWPDVSDEFEIEMCPYSLI